MSLCYSIVCLFALRSTVYFSSQLPSLWDQLEALWRQERNNAGETVDICDARNPAEITSKTEEGSEISGGADGTETILSGSESKEDEPNEQDDPVEELLVVEELEEEKEGSAGVLENSQQSSAVNKANVATQTKGAEEDIESKGSDVKENVGRERKEEKEGVNKAEETKEDLCDSGLEISGQEGSANFADVTDDPKKKKAEGKSGEAKQGDDSSHPLEFSWRVLIVWSDPEMHREVRR